MKKNTSKNKKPKTMAPSEKRFVFMKDDDSHLYLIPLELKEDFDEMLEQGEEDEWDAFNAKYGEYRANMHMSNYSFTDPQEIE